uniref:S-adenosylmethionine mitochondrial carrier protein-like n=1 Tax=Hirondellea gigas TaxID=1518452 RepID=A0A6A7FWK8_9CRUS
MMEKQGNPFFAALVSGASAGLAADVSLYPLDTLKTRLQSGQGFWAAGGFNRIYAGLGPAALASAPGASVFFCTYETVKQGVGSRVGPQYQPLAQMLAAGVGEVVACVIRVPTEVVKQRRQVQQQSTALSIIRSTLRQEGVPGLYRGYLSTVAREIPFSLIQFPLWEGFKQIWGREQGRPVDPWQAAVCGAAAGGLSAAATTPLDVAKTRIMLADAASPLASSSVWVALKHVHSSRGVTGLFAGVLPRTVWMATGGFVFLGVYDKVNSVIARLNSDRNTDDDADYDSPNR